MRAVTLTLLLAGLLGTGLCVGRLVQLSSWRHDWEWWRGRGDARATDVQIDAALTQIDEESKRWTTIAIPAFLLMLVSGALAVRSYARDAGAIQISPRYLRRPAESGAARR